MAEMAKGTHSGKLVVDWTRAGPRPDATLLPPQARLRVSNSGHAPS